MPISKPSINKEAIRMLVADVGYTETANRTGIKRDTLYQWAKRYSWNTPIAHAQESVRTVRPISDCHAEILAENGRETKLGLSEYSLKQAKHLASKGKLKDHQAFRNIVAGAASVHGWNDQQQGQGFSLNVLNLGRLSIGVNPEPEADTDAPGTDTLEV